jgi:hypothetical protein
MTSSGQSRSTSKSQRASLDAHAKAIRVGDPIKVVGGRRLTARRVSAIKVKIVPATRQYVFRSKGDHPKFEVHLTSRLSGATRSIASVSRSFSAAKAGSTPAATITATRSWTRSVRCTPLAIALDEHALRFAWTGSEGPIIIGANEVLEIRCEDATLGKGRYTVRWPLATMRTARRRTATSRRAR